MICAEKISQVPPGADLHYPVSLVMMKSGFISKLL